jgi:branched-chain amino acid transport system ATP-binding protein
MYLGERIAEGTAAEVMRDETVRKVYLGGALTRAEGTGNVATGTAPLLQVDDVVVRYGKAQAVQGVSLNVREGEFVALVGLNGAGKTTLFNAITGMTRASTGTVLLDGADITRAAPDARSRRGIARTFQITNLFFGLTVEDNLLLATRGLDATRFSLWRSDRAQGVERNIVDAALAKCRLDGKRSLMVRHLSYGEQRQLELALALAGSPKLLLLDEPTAGLSAAETARVVAMVRSLPRDITLLMIEHDMDVAFELADRISVLHQGRLVAEGDRQAIQANREVAEIYLGVE